jgi:GTP pyrophosphokinase
MERTYPVPVKIKAYDRQGLTSDITALLTSEGVNILNIAVTVNKSLAELRLIVEVKDLTHLSRILTRVENVPNVLEAVRTNPG